MWWYCVVGGRGCSIILWLNISLSQGLVSWECGLHKCLCPSSRVQTLFHLLPSLLAAFSADSPWCLSLSTVIFPHSVRQKEAAWDWSAQWFLHRVGISFQNCTLAKSFSPEGRSLLWRRFWKCLTVFTLPLPGPLGDISWIFTGFVWKRLKKVWVPSKTVASKNFSLPH